MAWLQVGKGVCQGCLLSLCLFNFFADYIVPDSRLNKAQGRIKIVERKINHLRYADNTILMSENEEELRSLLMKVREEHEKAGLKPYDPTITLLGIYPKETKNEKDTRIALFIAALLQYLEHGNNLDIH